MVVERSTLLTASQVASKIGLTAQRLNRLLETKGVYDTRIKRSRSFRHWFIEAGHGQIKQTASGYPQSLFTAKGEAWIIETFSKGVA
jgi:phage antirepressor YoqD-like protein